jgi:large subunit ribosomal protein L18
MTKDKTIKGTKDRPRLSVYRSAKVIYAQIIDDQNGVTLVAANEKQLAKKARSLKTKTARAQAVGELLAQKALKKKLKKVVFDRGRRPYHGRVKALAEGARKGGLKF